MVHWKGMYYLQEIMYPIWFLILGGYISLFIAYHELIYGYWYFVPFVIFWICVNRILWWYSKKQMKLEKGYDATKKN